MWIIVVVALRSITIAVPRNLIAIQKNLSQCILGLVLLDCIWRYRCGIHLEVWERLTRIADAAERILYLPAHITFLFITLLLLQLDVCQLSDLAIQMHTATRK